MLDNSNGNWIVLKHQYITCKVYFQANMRRTLNGLTHWGRVMHICISKLTIIGSENGLVTSHYLNQWWNIVNRTLGNKLQWNLNQNLYILIQGNALENVVWKWRPFCLSFNELTWLPDCDMFIFMIITLKDKITHLLFFVIILFHFLWLLVLVIFGAMDCLLSACMLVSQPIFMISISIFHLDIDSWNTYTDKDNTSVLQEWLHYLRCFITEE